MQINQVKYIHFRRHAIASFGARGEMLPKGGATVAWYVDEQGNTVVGPAARCSVNDIYVKETGRKIALANLNKAPWFVIPKEKAQQDLEATAVELGWILKDHFMPSLVTEMQNLLRGRAAMNAFNGRAYNKMVFDNLVFNQENNTVEAAIDQTVL